MRRDDRPKRRLLALACLGLTASCTGLLGDFTLEPPDASSESVFDAGGAPDATPGLPASVDAPWLADASDHESEDAAADTHAGAAATDARSPPESEPPDAAPTSEIPDGGVDRDAPSGPPDATDTGPDVGPRGPDGEAAGDGAISDETTEGAATSPPPPPPPPSNCDASVCPQAGTFCQDGHTLVTCDPGVDGLYCVTSVQDCTTITATSICESAFGPPGTSSCFTP